MNKTKTLLTLALALVLSLALLTGCGGAGDNNKVEIGMVNWAEGVAMSNLVKVVVEENLDYTVNLTMGDAGPIYASIANGSSDAFLDAWLPSTHKEYMEKFDGQLELYGTIFEGARTGLVVPEYVEANSIEDLNDMKGLVDGKIVGIDSGAGIMGATEQAIKDYGLEYELQTGSGPVMTAALADAIDNNEPIIVTGWAPHWKFGRWDLKFLDDPKGAFGEAETIHSVVRLGLADDKPEFAAFLKNFSLNEEELSGLMAMVNESNQDPIVPAREWAEQNADTVAKWFEGVK